MTQAQRSELLHTIYELIFAINKKNHVVYLTTTKQNQVTLDCLTGWVFNVNDLNLMTYALDIPMNENRSRQIEAAHAANFQRNFSGGYLFTRAECYVDIYNVLTNGVRYESNTIDTATRADFISTAATRRKPFSPDDLGTTGNW